MRPRDLSAASPFISQYQTLDSAVHGSFRAVADIFGFCNIEQGREGNIDMNDTTIGLDLAEEDILAYEVSDEALESAAVLLRDRAGSVTVSFCSGLDSCPS
jgi:hypothetical protein